MCWRDSLSTEEWNRQWREDVAMHNIRVRSMKMNFGQAITELIAGKKVARSGWNGVGMFLKVQLADIQHNDMTLPYIYINTVDNNRVPWTASQTDIFANDWTIVT